jgi:hypothetical protein
MISIRNEPAAPERTQWHFLSLSEKKKKEEHHHVIQRDTLWGKKKKIRPIFFILSRARVFQGDPDSPRTHFYDFLVEKCVCIRLASVITHFYGRHVLDIFTVVGCCCSDYNK